MPRPIHLPTLSSNHRNALLIVLIGLIVIALAVGYRFLDRELERRAEAPLNVINAQDSGDTFTDLAGNRVSLKDYTGGYVAIVTWASWCPSCQAQLDVVRQAMDGRDIPTLALNRMEPRDTIESYLAVYGAVGGLTYLIDTKDLFHHVTEGFAVPEFLLFNGRGEVVLQTRGESTVDELKAAIDAALAD